MQAVKGASQPLHFHWPLENSLARLSGPWMSSVRICLQLASAGLTPIDSKSACHGKMAYTAHFCADVFM